MLRIHQQCLLQRGRYLFLLSIPSLDKYGTRPFFRWVWAQSRSRCTRQSPKYLGPCRHSSKEGRLRRQAINVTPPKRVKAWGDSPLRLEGTSVPKHTRPEPCPSQTRPAKVRPNNWRGVPLCNTTNLQRGKIMSPYKKWGSRYDNKLHPMPRLQF